MFVAAYIEQHPGSKPTVKLHLAAIRMCFDWLVTGGYLPTNPAFAVRGNADRALSSSLILVILMV
jgi:integrase/recombinase XerD